MRKQSLIILLFLGYLPVYAQTETQLVVSKMKAFHQALVKKDTAMINKCTDDRLMYTHSNGLMERRDEIIEHTMNGYLTYASYKEDSISVSFNNGFATANFNADITATLSGNTGNYRLKVEEIWMKVD